MKTQPSHKTDPRNNSPARIRLVGPGALAALLTGTMALTAGCSDDSDSQLKYEVVKEKVSKQEIDAAKRKEAKLKAMAFDATSRMAFVMSRSGSGALALKMEGLDVPVEDAALRDLKIAGFKNGSGLLIRGVRSITASASPNATWNRSEYHVDSQKVVSKAPFHLELDIVPAAGTPKFAKSGEKLGLDYHYVSATIYPKGASKAIGSMYLVAGSEVTSSRFSINTARHTFAKVLSGDAAPTSFWDLGIAGLQLCTGQYDKACKLVIKETLVGTKIVETIALK